MKTHKPWTMTAKAGGELEILLYEEIGESFFGEGTSSKGFAEDLKAAGNVSKIHLRVNSPGGNVFDGIAIYNTLLSHGATVTAQVDGLAASIASVILMAASEIAMGDNAMLMIHNPRCVIAGDPNDMRKMADTMDKVKTSMITAYRRHSPKSVAEIGALMDAETWMTAQETVDNGFADKIITPEGDDADMAANFDLSVFRKVPQQIAARFGASSGGVRPGAGKRPPKAAATVCACECVACMKDDCSGCVNADCADDDCVNCAMQARAQAQALATALATVETLTGKVTALEAERCTLVKAKTSMEKDLAEARQPKPEAWLARLSGDLERGAKLSASAVKNLPQERAAAESLIAELSAEVETLSAALAAEKTSRLEETVTQSKFTERLTGELQRAGELQHSALEEFPRVAAAAQAGSAKLQAQVETLSAALAAEKTARLEETVNHAKFTQRLTGELQQASALHAAAVAEFPRIAAAAEARIDRVIAELETSQHALAAEKALRLEEQTAHAQVLERVTGELREAGKLHAAAVEELPRLVAAAGSRITGIAAELETARAALAAANQARTAESTAYAQNTRRLAAELSSAGKLYAAAVEGLPQHISSAAARVTQLTAELESAQTALVAEKEARSQDACANVQWTERMTATLKQAGITVEELPRRSRAAEAHAAQIATDLAATRTSIDQKRIDSGKKEREGAVDANSDALIDGLASAGKLFGDAAEELSRRSRTAEAAGAQIATEAAAVAQSAMEAGKRSEHAADSAKSAERLIAGLSDAGKIYAAAVEELPRRSRAAEARATQITTGLAVLPGAIEAAKKSRTEEAAARAEDGKRLAGELQKAATLVAAAAEELPRRAHAAEFRATQLQAEIAELATAVKAAQAVPAAVHSAAHAEEIARLTAQLHEAGKLYAAALEELPRRARANEQRHSQIQADLESTRTGLDAGKKSRMEVASARTREIERMTAELAQASSLYAAAGEEIARRVRLSALSS